MICEKCGAENLPDTRFCEACGHELGSTPEPSEEATVTVDEPEDNDDESAPARPGSLRDEIPFLTGAVDQAKARFQGWQQKNARKKTEKVRDKEFSEQRAAQQPESKEQSSMMSRIMAFLVGILALAAFIYLLIRYPRNASPAMAWALVEHLVSQPLN